MKGSDKQGEMEPEMSTNTKFEQIKKFEADLTGCTKCGYCTFPQPCQIENQHSLIILKHSTCILHLVAIFIICV